MLSLVQVRAIMVAYRVDVSDASRERHDGDALWRKLESAADCFTAEQLGHPDGRELGYMTWHDETPGEDGRLPPRSAATCRGGLRVRIALKGGQTALIERCSRGIEVTVGEETHTISIEESMSSTDVVSCLETIGLLTVPVTVKAVA